MEDSFLIQQVNSGHTAAYKLLVLRYERPIFGFLHSYGLRKEEINEVAQEVFLKAFKNLKSFDASKASFATWVFTIAKNEAINEKRRHAQFYETLDQESIQEAVADEINFEQNEKSHQVKQALAKLPETFRTVITLSFFKELSIKEIAKIEAISEGTVKSRIYRGKQMLKELLAIDFGREL